MAFVAVEFEENQLLVAVAQKSGYLPKVSTVLTVDITDLSHDAAGKKLEAELNNAGVSRCEVVAIVSRSMAEVRELTVPPAPDEELPDMIRFQARNEFAALNDNWKLDFVPLTSDATAARKVLAAAISPQLESRIEAVCANAGMKLKRIVLRPFATIDLLKPKLDSGQVVLVVDQNVDSADMSVVKNGQLSSTRTAQLPSSLSPEQRARQLIVEVRRTLASHKMSAGGDSISEVVVSGEEVRNRHLKGDLESKLGLKVSFVAPFDLVNTDDQAVLKDVDDTARFASLLGALKTEISGERPQLDFINFRKTEVKKTDLSKLYFYGAIAASIVFFCMVVGWWILRSQNSEIIAAKKRLGEAISLNEGNGRVRSVDQRLREIDVIDQWKMRDVNWLTEMSEFSSRYLLPDDVIADSFSGQILRDGSSQIVLKGRIVEKLDKTDQLIKKLSSRPYRVDTMDDGTVAPDQKSDYPLTFVYNLALPETATTDLRSLNLRAAEHIRDNQSSEADPSDASVGGGKQ